MINKTKKYLQHVFNMKVYYYLFQEDKNMCEFFVTDKSTNGTFILHKNNILDKESIMNNNKWIKLIKNK